MKSKRRSLLGPFIIVIGLIMVAFGVQLTAFILVPILGINHTVFYQIRGGYYFANPHILTEWVSIITIVGFVVCAIGMRILRIRPCGSSSMAN
jgi:uncharacterized membrane protein